MSMMMMLMLDIFTLSHHHIYFVWFCARELYFSEYWGQGFFFCLFQLVSYVKGREQKEGPL